MPEQQILFEARQGQHGRVGLVILNRPDALNALTLNMCEQMYRQLFEWAFVDDIKAVVVSGVGDRAFCAGGDIKAIYQYQNNLSVGEHFFQTEYKLDALIHHFPKPYIALMDGITMGGGLGISAHASFRIATERSKFAMPETGIGFFPDVGASYFLTRLKGKIGWYLGLSGEMINASDALYAGLVDAQIDSKSLGNFIDELVELDGFDTLNIQALIQSYEQPSEPSKFLTWQTMLDQCFSESEVENIIDQLNQHDSLDAKSIRDVLLSRSPTSLKVTLESLRKGVDVSFDECIALDYIMACRFLRASDFYEGIRAVLIDKDKQTKWCPKKLSEVSREDVKSYFKK